MRVCRCVFAHDGFETLPRVWCPILALCARGDVLWSHFQNIIAVRPGAEAEEIEGFFALDRGTEAVTGALERFFGE